MKITQCGNAARIISKIINSDNSEPVKTIQLDPLGGTYRKIK